MRYKRIVAMSVLLVVCVVSAFAQTPVYTGAKLQKVKVYRSGAEMEHHVSVAVPKGTSEVVIGQISDKMDISSLRVKTTASGPTVLSSEFVSEYEWPSNTDISTPEEKRLAEKIEAIKQKLERATIEKETKNKAIALIDQNKFVGDRGAVTAAQLRELLAFYTAQRTQLSLEVKQLEREIAALNLELSTLKGGSVGVDDEEEDSDSKGAIVVRLLSKEAQNVKLSIEYMTRSASWTPNYMLRVSSENEPVEMVLRANVRQKSGINWRGVHLTLVDAIPTRRASAPSVDTWFIRPIVPESRMEKNAVRTLAYSQEVASMDMLKEYTVMAASVSNMLNQSFVVNVPYNIQSNNRDHLIALSSERINATYRYFAYPAGDSRAYLMAHIKDLGKNGLFAASATVIMQGMQVSETYINPSNFENGLDLTLGEDRRLSVSHKLISDKSGTKFFSSEKEETRTYEISIVNNKKERADIEIKDRIPVSTANNIKVELLEHSGAELNEETGILTWKLNIPGNSVKKLRVSFKVRYPKDMNLERF
ncbi:MAG: DUF4139 domain-containing protein [Porphyromonas sp.]|nr:DUF4139 domain-containing protein [Porphyromonas sp.]